VFFVQGIILYVLSLAVSSWVGVVFRVLYVLLVGDGSFFWVSGGVVWCSGTFYCWWS
jgi:hypothetical protein